LVEDKEKKARGRSQSIFPKVIGEKKVLSETRSAKYLFAWVGTTLGEGDNL